MLLKIKLFGRNADVRRKRKTQTRKEKKLLGCLCTEFLHKKYGTQYNKRESFTTSDTGQSMFHKHDNKIPTVSIANNRKVNQ
jgi:hypothetical protein